MGDFYHMRYPYKSITIIVRCSVLQMRQRLTFTPTERSGSIQLLDLLHSITGLQLAKAKLWRELSFSGSSQTLGVQNFASDGVGCVGGGRDSGLLFGQRPG